MAVDFFFDPPTCNLPSLGVLRDFFWEHMPSEVADVLSQEYQYLKFHSHMLDSVHFTAEGKVGEKPWKKPLGLSVRAGAIKAALLVAASISEAVLRVVAEARGYPLPANPRHRTFGKVIEAWESVNGNTGADVAHLWDTVKELKDVRNNVHLFKAAGDAAANFQAILGQENDLLPRVIKAVDELAKLKP